MSGQVILYFDDQADALRFALAAGSVMAGDGARVTNNLIQETARINRISLDASNGGASHASNSNAGASNAGASNGGSSNEKKTRKSNSQNVA